MALVTKRLMVLQKLLRSEEHTSELQSRPHLVCRLLLEKKKCAQLQRGACEEDERQRELGDDEHGADPLAPPARRSARAVLQGSRHLAARGLARRDATEA